MSLQMLLALCRAQSRLDSRILELMTLIIDTVKNPLALYNGSKNYESVQFFEEI